LSNHSYVELNQLINDDNKTTYLSDENKKFNGKKYNDSNWEILSLKEINEKFSIKNEFDGVVWLRQTFDYQKNQVVDLEFEIGEVNEFFDIFINGKFVNRRKGYGKFESRFLIPDNILNQGINTIAIRIADMYGDGGLLEDEERGIYYNNKKIYSFFDTWKVRFSSWKTNNRLYNLEEGLDEIVFPSKLRMPREGSKPTMLYNSLISPISPYSVKGFIWYQGENNVTRYENYRSTFLSVIKTYRKKWGNEKLPFYYVQIAPHEYANRRNQTNGEFAANLREQQRLTLLEENVGMAVTMDIGDSLDIHPKIKKPVGKRLALWALAKDYGYKNLTHSGPLFKEVNFQKGKAIVSFDHIGSGLHGTNKKLKYFEIAGKDKIFQTANAQIKGDKVIVWSKKVPIPLYVRYGWKNFLTPNFFNKEGLPASSFNSINHFKDE
jgi:sialate O-acetylesterase